MSSADSTIVIVPKKGSTLPVGECVLVKETSESYFVKATSKTGRGKGAKTVLRQYVLPKSEVAYLYQEREISAEEADKYPSDGSKPAKRGRGRPKKTETVAAAPAKRGRGRPKKDATAAAAAPAKRGRGRPKKAESGANDKPKKGPGRPKKSDSAPVEATAPQPTETVTAAPPPDQPAKTGGASLFTDFSG